MLAYQITDATSRPEMSASFLVANVCNHRPV